MEKLNYVFIISLTVFLLFIVFSLYRLSLIPSRESFCIENGYTNVIDAGKTTPYWACERINADKTIDNRLFKLGKDERWHFVNFVNQECFLGDLGCDLG